MAFTKKNGGTTLQSRSGTPENSGCPILCGPPFRAYPRLRSAAAKGGKPTDHESLRRCRSPRAASRSGKKYICATGSRSIGSAAGPCRDSNSTTPLSRAAALKEALFFHALKCVGEGSATLLTRLTMLVCLSPGKILCLDPPSRIYSAVR